MRISLYPWLKQSGVVVIGLLAIAGTACQASANLNHPSTVVSAVKQQTTETELLQQNAVQVIQDYYGAIDQGDYRQAYLAWDQEGAASQQSFDQFKQGFENTASTSVTVGESGSLEGAAGSTYIVIPVTINAVTQDGVQQEFSGSYTLRKVNRVFGSTPTQRQWHIYSADITPSN